MLCKSQDCVLRQSINPPSCGQPLKVLDLWAFASPYVSVFQRRFLSLVFFCRLCTRLAQASQYFAWLERGRKPPRTRRSASRWRSGISPLPAPCSAVAPHSGTICSRRNRRWSGGRHIPLHRPAAGSCRFHSCSRFSE